MMNDTVPAFRWSSATLTNVGTVRQVNEDACMELLLPQSGLWVVADGMGGHKAGDLASQMIVDALHGMHWHARLEDFVADIRTEVEKVNQRLVEIAQSRGEDVVIGSTIALLVAMRRKGVCMWAGDSRVYRYRDGRMERLTRDHSEVEDLIDQGEILREEAEEHPSANVITRAVGADWDLELDVCQHDLRHGDRYLLCSDGLFKELSEEEIAEFIPRGECVQVCRELIDTALARGARDNVTVIVTEFQEAVAS